MIFRMVLAHGFGTIIAFKFQVAKDAQKNGELDLLWQHAGQNIISDVTTRTMFVNQARTVWKGSYGGNNMVLEEERT